MKLTVKNYGPEYYEEHRANGLDYLGHGEWQEQYAKWIRDTLELRSGMRMLDIGCACGSILEGFRKQGLECVGIDLSEHMVRLGREHFPELRLEIMDAVNMHLFEDESFDFIHSAQVAEHWNPILAGHILTEIRRVAKPGAAFFCCMDTVEFFDRHGRKVDGPGEDPTHQCIRNNHWWKSVAGKTKWIAKKTEHFKEHPLAGRFLGTYDWDFFLWRKA